MGLAGPSPEPNHGITYKACNEQENSSADGVNENRELDQPHRLRRMRVEGSNLDRCHLHALEIGFCAASLAGAPHHSDASFGLGLCQ